MAVHFAAGGPWYHRDHFAVDGDLEAVIGDGHGHDLSGVDHADVDALGAPPVPRFS